MLRASAKEFAFAPPVEPFYFDAFIESVLLMLPKNSTQGYYIKGGKAYNHYFPQGYVPSSDYDLVATNDVCDMIFDELVHALSVLDRPMYVEGYEPFYVSSVNVPTQANYKDISIVTGKPVTNTVRSFSVRVDGMDVALIDVIIEDEQNIAKEAEQAENGLWYMNRELFKRDLMMTYQSREKMVRYVHTNPPKRATQKSADKAASLEHKLAKSQYRYETSLQGRKRRSVRRSVRRSTRSRQSSARSKKHSKRV